MEEPAPWFMKGSTKYLMPLLAPGVSLKSTLRMKLRYLRSVMMSPPLVLSLPSPLLTARMPSSMVQPWSGKEPSLRALCQPAELLPSKRSFQPSAISSSVRVLAMQLTTGAGEGLAYFSTSCVMMRMLRQQTLAPWRSGLTVWTWRAMKPSLSTSSIRLVQAMPFTQVRMWLPMTSTRAEFQPSR